MNLKLLNELFKSTYFLEDGSHCWLYNGLSRDKDGYKLKRINLKMIRVHRLSLCIFFSLDYDDKSWTANHICGNVWCWNPCHLYQGTNLENNRDKFRDKGHHESNKTHCPQGHEYNITNTYYYKGKRQCIMCRNSNRIKSRTKHNYYSRKYIK